MGEKFGDDRGWVGEGLEPLLDELSIGVVHLDEDLSVRHRNLAASTLIDGRAGPELALAFEEMAVRAREAPLVESVLSLGRQGEVRVLVSGTRCVSGFVAVLERDDTTRARAEVQVLRAILLAATEVIEPAAAAHRALATLGHTLLGSSLVLYEHQPAQDRLSCLAHFNVPPGHAALLGLREVGHQSSLVGRAFETGQALQLSDLSTSIFPAERALAGVEPCAAIALPVRWHGGVIGVLFVWGPTASRSAGELQVLLGLADALGSLLRHARKDERLEQQQVALEALMAHLPDAVIEQGPTGEITQAGGRCEPVFGTSAAALVGQPLSRFFSAPQQLQFDALIERSRAGQSGVAWLEVSGADRKPRHCEVSVWVTGEVVRAIFRDLTERRLLEHELARIRSNAIEQDRLVRLGQLAASMAHEIKNPLAYVKANLGQLAGVQRALNELMAQVNGPGPRPQQVEAEISELTTDLEDMSRETLNGVNRITAIVGTLKGLARSRGGAVGSLDPSEALQLAVKFFVGARRCEKRVSLQLGPLPRVLCESGRLSQVVLNLLENALDAMGAEGRVVISAEVNERALVLRVADEGPGMPPEVQAHLFEPFFTTKGPTQGTGLGLHISKEIVESFGGQLRFESSPQGTTFFIELLVEPPAEGETHG